MDARQSQRNIFAAAAAGCIGSTGFTLVMPFLPLYIAELGKRSGVSAFYQRQMNVAIKRARYLALLPYVGE